MNSSGRRDDFNCMWSEHRCEILTTSKMYTSVSLFSLLRLIRGKLTRVVLKAAKIFIDYVGELVLQIRDEALVRNIQNDRTDFLHFWKYLLPFADAILVQKRWILPCVGLFPILSKPGKVIKISRAVPYLYKVTCFLITGGVYNEIWLSVCISD